MSFGFIVRLAVLYLEVFPARGGMQFRAAAYGSEVRLAATDFQGFPSAQIKFVRAALCFKDKVQLFHAVNFHIDRPIGVICPYGGVYLKARSEEHTSELQSPS